MAHMVAVLFWNINFLPIYPKTLLFIICITMDLLLHLLYVAYVDIITNYFSVAFSGPLFVPKINIICFSEINNQPRIFR